MMKQQNNDVTTKRVQNAAWITGLCSAASQDHALGDDCQLDAQSSQSSQSSPVCFDTSGTASGTSGSLHDFRKY